MGNKTIKAVSTRISTRNTGPNSGAATRRKRNDDPQTAASNISSIVSRTDISFMSIYSNDLVDMPTLACIDGSRLGFNPMNR